MLYSYIFTSTMYQTSYRKLPPRRPPQPYGNIASPHPHTAQQACKCTLSGPESRILLASSSSRTDRRSPWAVPYSPWRSCTSLARNDSFALPRERGRCLRISRNTCVHRFCKLRLGSSEECCSNFELASCHRPLPLDHTHRS